MRRKYSWLVLALYLVFTLAPIYWMVHMSLRNNLAITSTFAWLPESLSFANYATIFTDPAWYDGYLNSIIYVVLNTILSVAVALPAAYAFSRYSFLGDKHLFFWLLTNRMTPPAVFLLPFFQLYTAIGLMDTHLAVALAHMVFNVPLAVWILEGFMSAVPREIDETAYIDGYSFPRFFVKLFLPLIKAGIGVTAFLLHVLVGRAAARAHAHVGRRQADCRDHDAHRVGSRHGLGNARRRRRADDRAGRAGDLLRAPLHRQGLRHGEGVMSLLSWMAWTPPVAIFFVCIGALLVAMTVWEVRSPTVARRGLLPLVTTRGDRLFIGLLAAGYVNLAWAGLSDLPQWWGAGLSAVALVAIMRWG